MNPFVKALAIATLAVAGLAAAAPASAQAFPSRPIRIIVPFAPGGTSDILARLLAPKLQEALGQPVIVENKPGANGMIGADMVAKAQPDGHTLALMDVGNLSIAPSIYPNMPFDIVKDFAHVTLLSYTPHLLAVKPTLPVNSAKELVKYAKDNPGKLNYGTTGLGSAPHLAGILFSQGLDLKWEDIPAKGGAESILHVMQGQVDVLFNGMVATIPHVRSGKLKLLAVSSDKRIGEFPDVPTVTEATGLANFMTGSWQGILASPGTPKPIIEKLRAEIAKAAGLPDVKERLTGLGADPVLNTPDEFAGWLRSEQAKWQRVVKIANLKVQ
jgi:tripartite-type tricarboxylate transporter receptor subunit TctC